MYFIESCSKLFSLGRVGGGPYIATLLVPMYHFHCCETRMHGPFMPAEWLHAFRIEEKKCNGRGGIMWYDFDMQGQNHTKHMEIVEETCRITETLGTVLALWVLSFKSPSCLFCSDTLKVTLFDTPVPRVCNVFHIVRAFIRAIG